MADKNFLYSGADTMRILMDQERKHWLLKTDKSKTLQDKETGDMFKSVIDNNGGEIVLSTEKLTDSNNFFQALNFNVMTSSGSDILEFQSSAFTYCPAVNGLTFARVKASKYPYSYGGSVQYFNYKIKFENCEIVTLLFGTSKNSSNVIPTKWIKTSTAPKVVVINTADSNNVIVEQSLAFVSDITNPVWYYPLTESLQPFALTETAANEYTTSLVVSDNNIGYPMYWFTCDNSNIGPNVTITDAGNVNNNGDTIIHFGSEGNSSRYNVLGYVGIDGNEDATPTCDTISNFFILVHPKDPNVTFSGNILTDKRIDLSRNIVFRDDTDLTEHTIPIVFSSDEGSTILMNTDDCVWNYEDDTTYSIQMNTFDRNCVNTATSISTLLPFIKIHLDETVPFEVDDTDYGMAGVYMSSMNPKDDIQTGYPFDISNFDGLPTWMTTDEPDRQRLAMYAIHNTPFYAESNPMSRQVSGLLFDLGEAVPPDSDESLSSNQYGRIYYVGNDPAEYENNATSEHPKPARTLARICDIPTSVVQLSNISGLAPSSIVDKKYVRTEASYTEEEKDRVWNILSSRWVRPSNVDEDNNPIYSEGQTMVFNSEEDLNRVDLISHNDFRYRLNLNPKVNTDDVYISSITERGLGYAFDDNILLVVGGFSFNIEVLTVDADGGVLTAGIGAAEASEINLSNFNMNSSGSGNTEEYSTSPRNGSGSGFKCILGIRNYSQYQPKKGGIFEDLFAVVHLSDGIYFYQYKINHPSKETLLTGTWVKGQKISSLVDSSQITADGNLSVEDAYTVGNIPHYRSINVQRDIDDSPTLTIVGMKTNNCINIPSSSAITPLNSDINKFYSNGETLSATATMRTPYGVSKALHDISKLYYDSYIIWRWKTNSSTDLNFEYAIIRRSLNNYISTDVTNYLPPNNLYVKDYLHTNDATTIVWNTPDNQTFIFVFDAEYQKHESYQYINNGFQIQTKDFSLDDIDIKTSASYIAPVLFDGDGPLGKLAWNIMTTSPTLVHANGAIRVDNDVVTFQDWEIGIQRQNITHVPVGGWRCIMPKQTKFRFINGTTQVVPIQMDVIRRSATASQQTVRFVKDSNAVDVSDHTLIIDTNTSTNETHLKVYNPSIDQFQEL